MKTYRSRRIMAVIVWLVFFDVIFAIALSSAITAAWLPAIIEIEDGHRTATAIQATTDCRNRQIHLQHTADAILTGGAQ